MCKPGYHACLINIRLKAKELEHFGAKSLAHKCSQLQHEGVRVDEGRVLLVQGQQFRLVLLLR